MRRDLINQFLWLAWIVASRNYGMLPMAVVLTAICTRERLLQFKQALPLHSIPELSETEREESE